MGAITLLLAALWLAARPAGEMTYDLKRAEILSTLVNGATWLTLGLLIVYKRIRRLIAPPTPAGAAVLILPLVAPRRSGVAATGMLSVRRPRPCRLAGASGPYRGTG